MELKDKAQLRAQFKSLRRSEVKSELKSHKICGLLAKVLEQNGTGLCAIYNTIQGEVDIQCLAEKTVNWRFCYPKVLDDGLGFYIPKSKSSFSQGAYGVSEPVIEESEPVDVKDIQVVCVPGLAFDRKGARLGMGKGFYDRCLAGFEALKVGVGFQSQIVNYELPLEAHDIKMDILVTENFIMELNVA